MRIQDKDIKRRKKTEVKMKRLEEQTILSVVIKIRKISKTL